jgi:hypothetical protein
MLRASLHLAAAIRWQPVYRPDDPTFAIPYAHRFAVIPTTWAFADAAGLDAWPYARFLLEVLTFLGGEPVYGTADERDPARRPKLLLSEEATRLTTAYLVVRFKQTSPTEIAHFCAYSGRRQVPSVRVHPLDA